MTIPKLDPAEAAYFARLIVDLNDYEDLDASEKATIEGLCNYAENYAKQYTGLKLLSEAPTDVDNNEHLKYALKCIVGQMWDNRNTVDEYSNDNRLVRSVLNLHCVNGVPEV